VAETQAEMRSERLEREQMAQAAGQASEEDLRGSAEPTPGDEALRH
jgi:hypothetical protein